MNAELKPCPFCGSEAELFEAPGVYFVECSNPKCNYPTNWDTKEEAVTAWNTRVYKTGDIEMKQTPKYIKFSYAEYSSLWDFIFNCCVVHMEEDPNLFLHWDKGIDILNGRVEV